MALVIKGLNLNGGSGSSSYDDTALSARVSALEDAPSAFPAVTWENSHQIMSVGYDSTAHGWTWKMTPNDGGCEIIEIIPNENENITNWHREIGHTLARDYVKALKEKRPIRIVLHSTQAAEVDANGPFGFATIVFELSSYMMDVNDEDRVLVMRFVNPILGANTGNVVVYHAYNDTSGTYAGYMERE